MKQIKAVIFDMDGVLIDSEPLWREAMIKGFNEFGIVLTEEDCRKTTGKRFIEVAEHWRNLHPQVSATANDIETAVVTYLLRLIEKEGKAIAGVEDLLKLCLKHELKIGLATSSGNALMQAVLNKLRFHPYFDATLSAEFLQYAKPHPEVFLACASKLSVSPNQCLVIEDSVNGLIAAKAAQMKVLVVPENNHPQLALFSLANYHCSSMFEAKICLSSLLAS